MPDTTAPDHAANNAAEDANEVLRTDQDGVATLTLNRPDQYNTLSMSVLRRLQDELESIARQPEVRVVVIAGTGKAFCVGHDLREMQAAPDADSMESLFDTCSAMMQAIVRLPQPVIAKVQGVAAAAGCQLVAQCDMAVAIEDAKFATSGVKLGLFCSTPMVALTRNLPRKKAFEMLMTGELIDAHEAERLGLVNRVVPTTQLDSAVDDLASRIVDKSPLAIRRGKELFYRQYDAPLNDAYEDASRVITENTQDRDARAGIEAFLAKRDMPEWTGE